MTSQKFGDSLFDGIRVLLFNKTDEKLEVKSSFFVTSFAKHELTKLLIIYMTTRDHPRSEPHGPGPAGVSAAHEIFKMIESPLAYVFCVGELRTTENNPIYRHEFILNQLYNKFEIYDPTFLSGVPFLPYQRTGKIKSFAGPLSDHWVASQAELGKKIVSRAIELDMKPILPTFSGLVPESIISSPYQDASTIRSQPFGSLRLIFKFQLWSAI